VAVRRRSFQANKHALTIKERNLFISFD